MIKATRPLHPEMELLLTHCDANTLTLFHGLRNLILNIYPESNELLYHTHAITTVFTPTTRLGDGFCHLPIYSAHLNLGFNKGTLLADPQELLRGTGKLIRHVPIKTMADMERRGVRGLIEAALALSRKEMNPKFAASGQMISKIKPAKP